MHNTQALGQLRLIGKLSLWFSLVALIGLLFSLEFADYQASSYAQTIEQLLQSKARLPWLILIGGLLLGIGTGLTTWLITLYSTFRVAGPLHRFALDLDRGLSSGKMPRFHLRRDDELQDECRLLEQTTQQLQDYQLQLLGELDRALALTEQQDDSALAICLQDLQHHIKRPRLDDQPAN